MMIRGCLSSNHHDRAFLKKKLKPMVAPDMGPTRNSASFVTPIPSIGIRVVVLHVIMGSKLCCHMLKPDVKIRVWMFL